MKIFNFQYGVSIYLALVIMFILIAIGLGVSLIIVSQMKMIKGMGDSVIAFYTADTGIEHSLYDWRKVTPGNEGVVSGSLGSNQNYTVSKCDPVDECRQSIGSFSSIKIVKRGIKIVISGTPPPTFDYDITLDPTSGTGMAHCVSYDVTTVTTALTAGSDRSISFYIGTVVGPGTVTATFNPAGCDSVNCISNVDLLASAEGTYVINICGDTDILDKCAQFTYDVVGTGPPCPT